MAFRAGGLVFLVVIVQVVFCFPRSEFIHHMYEAREMLHVTSDHKMRDYVGYGNYCGMGGSGPVLDPIDMCCKIHDDCYGEITSIYGNLCDPHKGSYDFTVSRNTHTLGCDSIEIMMEEEGLQRKDLTYVEEMCAYVTKDLSGVGRNTICIMTDF